MAVFTLNRNVLFKDEVKIVNHQYDIAEFLVILESKQIILLEKTELFDNNVVSYDLEGNFLWRLEKTDYFHQSNSVTGVYLIDGFLFVYHQCGVEEKVDLLNGKIIESELIK